MESRGFIIGLPVAMALGLPFLMMRKPNKLSGNKVSCCYGLEVIMFVFVFAFACALCTYVCLCACACAGAALPMMRKPSK